MAGQAKALDFRSLLRVLRRWTDRWRGPDRALMTHCGDLAGRNSAAQHAAD
jgi:hypothetical protein